MQDIYIGVAWPYANADTLHIGHISGAYLEADIFARFHRLQGNRVLMVSGTDMHGTPVSVKAMEHNKPPKEYALENHEAFVKQLKTLGIQYEHYTSTHTPLHFEVVNTIGRFLYDQGYLVPKKTKMLFDTKLKRVLPDRYVEGECPKCGYYPARGDQCDNCASLLDPLELKNPKSKLSGTTPKVVEVTNLYLDLPKFAKALQEYLKDKTYWRDHVRELTRGFLKEGLKMRPVTRNLEWGVPVEIEGFKDQVWYVWFEAVIGYVSAAIEWDALRRGELTPPHSVIHRAPQDYPGWEHFWKNPEVRHYYFLGKDNIPFHTIIWPIQIMMFNLRHKTGAFARYKLPYERENTPLLLPYDVPANQFMLLNNAKLSKSLGNFISVNDLLNKYPVTAIRYGIARLLPEFKDTNFTESLLVELVNKELADNISNLVFRVYVLVKRNFGRFPSIAPRERFVVQVRESYEQIASHYQNVHLGKVLEEILKLTTFGNAHLNAAEPWKNPRSERAKQVLGELGILIEVLKRSLFPVVPALVEKIHAFLDQAAPLRWDYDFSVPRASIREIEPPFRRL